MHKAFWGVVTLMVGLTLGCSGPPPSAPADPPQLETTPEYPFGDHTAALDTAAWTKVWDQAQREFGDSLRMERRVMGAEIHWQVLQAYYDTALPATAGWKTDPAFVAPDATTRWSFARRHDKHIFAVVGLLPANAVSGQVPVNIITNLPE